VCAAALTLALAAPAGLASLAAAETTAPSGAGAVDLGGTPVDGGTAGQPTALTAGLWSDTLRGSGEDPANTRWFSYTRTMADSRVLVSAFAAAVDPVNDQIRVEVRNSDGEECGSYDDATASSAPGLVIGALKIAGLEGDDTCGSSPGLRIAVSRGSTSGLTSSMPFAVRLVEEAPVPDEAGLEPVEEPTLQTPERGKAVPTRGGRSFDDAPPVDGTVSDKVPQGAERFFKVRLGWGERLAWRLEIPIRPTSGDYTPDPQVEVRLFDPVRHPFDGGALDAETSGSYGAAGKVLADTMPEVTYSRTLSDVALVPGDYWVAVSVGAPTDDAPIDVPVELTVEVDGTVSGAPAFPEAVTGPGGTPPPDGYDKATPYLVAKGVFSADVSGTPTVPGAETDDDVRRLVGYGVGAVSLLSLLAGLVLLRRRTRVSRAAAR
jgi:hypothetical protein